MASLCCSDISTVACTVLQLHTYTSTLIKTDKKKTSGTNDVKMYTSDENKRLPEKLSKKYMQLMARKYGPDNTIGQTRLGGLSFCLLALTCAVGTLSIIMAKHCPAINKFG